MAQLVVRNLDEQIVRELKVRVASNGRSAEAEHRQILHQSLAPKPPRSIKDVLMSMPDVGEDADFERVRDTGREVRI